MRRQRQSQRQALFPESSLYFGDNLAILPRYIPDGSVDLVYLDPPFNSKRSYSAIFERADGTPAAAQIKAFKDTWQWNLESERLLKSLKAESGELSRLMTLLETLLGDSDMMAYLVMMAPRLVELRRVLRSTGSLYLHCDPTASHYLKMLLDAIFGTKQWRNEIVWKRTSGHSDARRYGRSHDVLLYYSAGEEPVWNQLFQPYDEDYVEQYYRCQDADGRRFMSGDASAAGLSGGGYIYEWNGVTREWRHPIETMQRLDEQGRIFYTRNGIPRIKRYLDEARGMPMQDVWTDLEAVRSWHKEKLPYPTQKPLALAERIIAASSNPGDVVLDPFCGCGTTVEAAQKLDRVWIGIDITSLAINVIEDRLRRVYPDIDYNVGGIPPSPDEVEFLAKFNKLAFQQWACDVLGSEMIVRPGKDRGIDGILRYPVAGGHQWTAIISVKGGGTGPTHVRDLRGTIERERAQAGIFVTVKPPTREMRAEAIRAGASDDGIPRIQIVTGADLVEGRMPFVPAPAGMPGTAPRPQAAVRHLRPVPQPASEGEAGAAN